MPDDSPEKLRDALSEQRAYSILKQLAKVRPRRRRKPVSEFYSEQYLMVERNEYVVVHESPEAPPNTTVEVDVPPLYHEVVTADLDIKRNQTALLDAQNDLEGVLKKLEREFGEEWSAASGLGVVVAWGLPYFYNFIEPLATLSDEEIPVDIRATKEYNGRTLALLEAMRFPSDPLDLILENNDVAIVLVSDYSEKIAHGVKTIFDTDLFSITSIRKGFLGSNFFKSATEPSLVKQLATRAGVLGADKIPDNAELFMGFTSTVENSLGINRVDNFESLGLTNQTRESYFAHGTIMHLSHIIEDLDLWYTKYFPDFVGRMQRMHGPARGSTALTVPVGTVTIDAGGMQEDGRSTQLLAADSSSPLVPSSSVVQSQVKDFGIAGHSASIQPVSRLAQEVTDPYGKTYKAGQAIPLRVDFNTLDNPFHYSSRPSVDGVQLENAAGVHFVVFIPTSDFFHRTRLAQDGRYNLVAPYAKPGKGGTAVAYDFDNPEYLKSNNVLIHEGAPLGALSRNMGFNAVASATHRQNFLVPPTEHRSFPLAELL
jgi:hypothetical protein